MACFVVGGADSVARVLRERFDNYSIPDKVRACPAQMAELVDALGSGPSGGNTVEVRVLFWAPFSPAHPQHFKRGSFIALSNKWVV